MCNSMFCLVCNCWLAPDRVISLAGMYQCEWNPLPTCIISPIISTNLDYLPSMHAYKYDQCSIRHCTKLWSVTYFNRYPQLIPPRPRKCVNYLICPQIHLPGHELSPRGMTRSPSPEPYKRQNRRDPSTQLSAFELTASTSCHHDVHRFANIRLVPIRRSYTILSNKCLFHSEASCPPVCHCSADICHSCIWTRRTWHHVLFPVLNHAPMLTAVPKS